MENILGFFKDYRFLSNYHLVSIEFEGQRFLSTENAFQAAKVLNLNDRKIFCECSPSQARTLGKKVNLREDWEQIKEKVMYDVNWYKFSNNPHLKKRLLNTQNAYLEETNTWGDVYWGVCDGKGRNRLGLILMTIRKNLRENSN